jgi:HSP20 family protein
MGSFFNTLSKLTSSQPSYDDDYVDEVDTEYNDNFDSFKEQEPAEGELSVDVYRDNDKIVIKTMTPGVKKDDLEISLSRDMLTIKGFRHDESDVHAGNYHHRELYWGSFSRTVQLPDEVDIDAAEASEQHGLVTITLPILDKKRQNRLKIKN